MVKKMEINTNDLHVINVRVEGYKYTVHVQYGTITIFPVGFLFCQVREDSKTLDWTNKEIQEANDQIMIRHNGGSRIVFPNGVRYI